MQETAASTGVRADVAEEIAATLRAICRAGATVYVHHEARPWDGKKPREGGGTIWLTPREHADRALRRLASEGIITADAADWREGDDR